jgi:hypothetical protein
VGERVARTDGFETFSRDCGLMPFTFTDSDKWKKNGASDNLVSGKKLCFILAPFFPSRDAMPAKRHQLLSVLSCLFIYNT